MAQFFNILFGDHDYNRLADKMHDADFNYFYWDCPIRLALIAEAVRQFNKH